MEMRGVWCLLVLVSCLALCVFSQTPSCTPDDFTAEYTQCTPNGLHSLVYYKKQGHVCTGDAPDAVYNIPCNISCHPGSYLPLGASACTQCDAGTFSIGGAQVWEDWESFPTGWGEFSTYCGLYSDPTTPGYCSNTWQLQGTYVSVTGLGRNQASILQLTVSMVTDGHIKFSYRADSDIGGEGFIFKMDGTIVYESDQQSPVFTDFIIYFGTGVHTFQFIYQCVGGLFGSNCAAGTAAINYLELAGLTYAVNNCTQCAPGYFATGQGNTECTICPVNSFSPGFGASSCTACPAGQYSYAGASGCLARVPCTASDTQVLLGACKSGSAVATTTFLEPMICDSTSYPLPGVHNVACTCNPGTYSTSSGCADCPLGYVNDGTHATCTPCPVGSAAVRMLNHTGLFNQFDPYEQTWCTGECGTNGWRLRGDHLDSGVGHGDRVSVYYQQNVTIEYEGYIAFFFSFQCNEPCTLTFVDVGYDYSTVLSSDVYGNGGNILFSPPQTLALGPHSFLWYFSQDLDPLNTPDAIERADMVSISEINIIGTTIGGASDCIPCGDGYYAEGSSICTACPAGQGSTADHAQCVTCTGNTISRGADTCHACGNNTQANFAQTDCTNTCEFVFNGRNYDIHNLAQWGPLTLDTGVYTYAISPCSRYSMPSACNDGNGNVLTTYACQIVDGSNYGWDIGWNAGFSPYVNDGAVGVRAEFNLGDPAGCDQGRRATVNVTCDGSSFFESLEGGVEIEPCHYAFTFKSAYACPICSEQDYTYYYTLCENGQRQQIFYWNEPKNCHDGVNLPLPATVDCSDSTHVCQAGTYLGADGQSCVACPAGEFSLGGGELIQNWEFLPSGFFSICNSNPCTLWENNDFSDETTITSGFGDSSLVADITFKRSGTLSFDYKVYSPANGTFKFLVDGVQQISVAAGANIITWTPFSVNVNAGTHDFRWQFTDGLLNSPSLLAFQAATLTNMVVLGLDYHDDTCTPCPVGTRSAYANESSVIGCVTCPYNTQAYTQGLDYCTPCDSDQYAFPGSQSCGPASYCSASDYITVYTPCAADGTRTATQVLKPPVICQEITPPPAPQTVGCAPCPPFTTRSGANCVGCPAGQYYSLSTGVCVANTPGNVVQRSVSYFIDNSTFSWPAGWSTGCSGLCLTPGWRILGSSIDSGYHAFYSEIDSYVQLNVTLDVVGSISFTYSLTSTDSSGSGLQLLLDGVAYPLAVADGSVPNQYLNASIALSAGNHLLLWNYHQGTGTGTATLQNVVVVGQQGALGASEPVACSPGQFSSDPTDTACSLCAAGSYASGNASVNCTSCGVNTYNLDLGASSCTPCENGSFTNQPGSLVCQTTCSFQIGSYTYNLPFNTTVSVFDATHNRYDINVCGFADQCSNSHVCLTSSTGGVSSVGSTFQFVPNPDNTTSTSQPFSIYFEHGAAQACNDDGSSSHTSTIIDFQCDTYSADIKTSVPTFAAVDGCTSRFLWQTIYACPVCTDADYKTTTGVCSGGKRQIQKTRQTSCNGDANIPVPDEKCSSHEFPTGAVVAVVVVFVVVVAIAVGIVVRNRYLAKQYSKLLQETHANTDNVSNNRNLSSAVL